MDEDEKQQFKESIQFDTYNHTNQNEEWRAPGFIANYADVAAASRATRGPGLPSGLQNDSAAAKTTRREPGLPSGSQNANAVIAASSNMAQQGTSRQEPEGLFQVQQGMVLPGMLRTSEVLRRCCIVAALATRLL